MKVLHKTVFVLMLLISIGAISGYASAAVDFPADEAGIACYVNIDKAIDLDAVKPFFIYIERDTPEYVVGTYKLSGHSETEYPLVYASNDGWIVAYYHKDQPASWIIPWEDYVGTALYEEGFKSTRLSKVVKNIASGLEKTVSEEDLLYYDFEYPDATNLVIVTDSSYHGENDFFTANVPSHLSLYAVDWSLYAPNTGFNLMLDDNEIGDVSGSVGESYGSLPSLVTYFQKGQTHTFKTVSYHSPGVYGTQKIGVVFVYGK